MTIWKCVPRLLASTEVCSLAPCFHGSVRSPHVPAPGNKRAQVQRGEKDVSSATCSASNANAKTNRFKSRASYLMRTETHAGSNQGNDDECGNNDLCDCSGNVLHVDSSYSSLLSC
jgi:hypothetical protein